jgi:pilus assembly protein Flp/PilA
LAKDDGATLVEYALLLALIAVVCVLAITLVGQNTNTLLNTAAHSL